MIYTMTLNPSIDYIVHTDTIKLGELNRMQRDLKLPGGKGINVSRILQRLAIPNCPLGFLGGFTGSFIQEWLEKEQITGNFTKIAADTRINIKLKSGEETEINGAGPEVSSAEVDALKSSLSHLTKEDIVVLSGSTLPCLPTGFYQELIRLIKEQGANFVIDTTGQDLLDALPSQPLLVKPNKEELAEIYQTDFTSLTDLITHGKKLLKDGAQHVILSMGGEGALLFTKQGVYQAAALKRPLKNSVGAGDSMIAGFIGQWNKNKNAIEAFKWGVACGSATAFSDDLATQSFIQELLPEVKITTLEGKNNENQ
ncbi:1-phosphofructokinase [Enterococcus sp. LJL98]